MAHESSLLAHLIPRLTIQVENAATDALGYILNESEQCMQALNHLLNGGGIEVERIASVRTQVTYEDGSRPDMVGYDANGEARLIVEAKFYAALQDDQASGYAEHFDNSGPAVLLFLCPEKRIPRLWATITRQIEQRRSLKSIESPAGYRRAKLNGTKLQLLLTSWNRLLDRMVEQASNDSSKSDIHQLRGLTQSQDAEAFLPIRSEELSPAFAHRAVWFAQLVDDVVDAHGVPEGWLCTKGLAATSRRYGYGRYFRFPDAEGDHWFGVNHEQWAKTDETPLWVRISRKVTISMEDVANALNVRVENRWIPIPMIVGVEYDEVINDVASQLKDVRRILAGPPTTE
jgi:hypothetical protein